MKWAMAERAISQSTCDDAISRKAVLELINNYGISMSGNKAYEDVCNGLVRATKIVLCDAIKNVSSVTPTQRWIPVSERPPEELTPVNITWVNRNPESYYKDIKDKPFTATGVYYKGKWHWYSAICEDMLAEYGRNEVDEIDADIQITAWMPLIEAYKEGSKNGA